MWKIPAQGGCGQPVEQGSFAQRLDGAVESRYGQVGSNGIISKPVRKPIDRLTLFPGISQASSQEELLREVRDVVIACVRLGQSSLLED